MKQRISFLTQTARRFEDEDYRGGIIDKTMMYEAVWQMGWHANFIWVK